MAVEGNILCAYSILTSPVQLYAMYLSWSASPTCEPNYLQHNLVFKVSHLHENRETREQTFWSHETIQKRCNTGYRPSFKLKRCIMGFVQVENATLQLAGFFVIKLKQVKGNLHFNK